MNRIAQTAASLGVIGLIAGPLAGCTTYHHVTEPASGREYLTTDLDGSARDQTGSAVFTDAVTGAEVTLSNSEVVRIGENEFKELLIELRRERDGRSQKDR